MSLMLIDAFHPSLTRMVVQGKDGEIYEFEQEFSENQSLKGNIYLATVTRVEPSLQAAFINFGKDKNGFLPFQEIHPDYFRIPVSDRRRIMEEHKNEMEDDQGPDGPEDFVRFRSALKRYKIQEVISQGQILLVQVVKEERGNKGAAVSTYLSIAGRYCVLMPNDPNSGGVSRKIGDVEDRQRLRQLIKGMPIPASMSLIIRTAGANRSEDEIRSDFEYLVNCWNTIRKKTLESHAPALVSSDGDIVMRSLRDFHNEDISAIYIDGPQNYNEALTLQQELGSDSSPNIVLHDREKHGPLFQKYGVERRLATLFLPRVKLPSGGYVVFHQTEALVAIDVNSGRATSERDIEGTALNTNLEAAEQIAKQLRLRDLAGLITIDFIDMVEYRNVRRLEKRVRDLFQSDRARVYIRNMSQFGTMEMSRQRLHSNQNQHIQSLCPHCSGSGFSFTPSWIAVTMMRMLEEEIQAGLASELRVESSAEVFDTLFNDCRELLATLGNSCKVLFRRRENLVGELGFKIWRTKLNDANDIIVLSQEEWQDVFDQEQAGDTKRARQGKRNERSRSGRSRPAMKRAPRRSPRRERAPEIENGHTPEYGPESHLQEGREQRPRRTRRTPTQRRRDLEDQTAAPMEPEASIGTAPSPSTFKTNVEQPPIEQPHEEAPPAKPRRRTSRRADDDATKPSKGAAAAKDEKAVPKPGRRVAKVAEEKKTSAEAVSSEEPPKPKKRGRPKGSKNKVKKTPQPALETGAPE